MTSIGLWETMARIVTKVCVEKFARAPEECPGVLWSTLWDIIADAEEEAQEIKKWQPRAK